MQALCNKRPSPLLRSNSPFALTSPVGVNGFNPADSAIICEFLDGDPIKFVDHCAFHKSNAERAIDREELGMDHVISAWHMIYANDQDMAKVDKSLLFTPAQERLAFLQYNYAKFRVRRVQEFTRVQHADLQRLLWWYRRYKHLQEVIVCANLGLCLSRVRVVIQRLLPREDLVSHANMALMRAVELFDVGKGWRFSTYGCRAIISEIHRNLGKEKKRKTHEVCAYDESVLPFAKKADAEDEHLSERALNLQQLRDVINHNKAKLSELELLIIKNRFPSTPKKLNPRTRQPTLCQVGRLLGEHGRPLTKERVRQIQKEAIEKIRSVMGVTL